MVEKVVFRSASGQGVFAPRIRRAIYLIVGLSVFATLGSMLWGQRLGRPSPTTRDSFGSGPLGHRAFFESIEAIGYQVDRLRDAEVFESRTPVLFLEPGVGEVVIGAERTDLSRLIEHRARRGLASVVVLPKWQINAEGKVMLDRAGAEDVLSAVLEGATLQGPDGESAQPLLYEAESYLGAFSVELPALQTIQVAQEIEVLASISGRALIVRSGPLVIISDPDLVHSWNMQRAENTELAVSVVENTWTSDRISVDETLHGHIQRRSIGTALSEFPTVLLTAQVVLLIALIVLYGSVRFGSALLTEKRPSGPGESIKVAAFVLAGGRSLSALTERYVRLQLEDIARRMGIVAASSQQAAARLDEVSVRRGLEAMATRLLKDAQAAPARPEARRAPLALAKRVHILRRTLLDAGRSAETSEPSPK